MINKKKVKSVLIISLSNIGDAILTTPVLRVVASQLPDAAIDVVASLRTAELFTRNKAVREVFVYDKKASLRGKVLFLKRLRSKRYDLVVDLKNSALPLLVKSRYRSGFYLRRPKGVSMKETHLQKVKALGFNIDNADFFIAEDEVSEAYAREAFAKAGLRGERRIAAVCPGARSDIKRWPLKNFIEICSQLQEKYNAFIVILGDTADAPLAAELTGSIKRGHINLCAKTDLLQLAAVLKKCDFLLCNDSAVMHMASAVGKPVVALFGPTDHRKYGPENVNSRVIYKNIKCAPCEKAQCAFGHECLHLITPQDVFGQIENLIKKTGLLVN